MRGVVTMMMTTGVTVVVTHIYLYDVLQPASISVLYGTQSDMCLFYSGFYFCFISEVDKYNEQIEIALLYICTVLKMIQEKLSLKVGFK